MANNDSKGGGGKNSGGNDNDDSDRGGFGGFGGYDSVSDMFDGGGPGQSGDTFGGALGDFSNSIGATPRGSGREPTGIAGAISQRDDAGRLSNTSAAIRGALMGGIPGMLAGVATNQITGGRGIEGMLGFGPKTAGQPTADKDRVKGAPMSSERPTMRPTMRPGGFTSINQGEGESNRPEQTIKATEKDTPPPLTMSEQAAVGGYRPILNPDYNPEDPMSQMFVSNPSYDQLLGYRDFQMAPDVQPAASAIDPAAVGPRTQLVNTLSALSGGVPTSMIASLFPAGPAPDAAAPVSAGGLSFYDPTGAKMDQNAYIRMLMQNQMPPVVGMAEGGEVMGGNEKDVISNAVSAVKGKLSEEQSALALGQFVASYGEDALRNLVDKVQSGELDDTVDRFANGEAGAVRGPGDGSGVDDKVPASLEGQQDVLLADGEFVLRKKTADALEKKYGGGFLDAVNKAETDAPRTMREYMSRN